MVNDSVGSKIPAEQHKQQVFSLFDILAPEYDHPALRFLHWNRLGWIPSSSVPI